MPEVRARSKLGWVLMQRTLGDLNRLRESRGQPPLRMRDVHHLSWYQLLCVLWDEERQPGLTPQKARSS